MARLLRQTGIPSVPAQEARAEMKLITIFAALAVVAATCTILFF